MAKWSVEYPHLDSEQKDFLNNKLTDNRNHWIKGFPGSGKSTILEHAVKTIKADNPNATIALAVYTHSLIAMFRVAFHEIGVSDNEVKVATMYDLLEKDHNHYDYILCDEVQDMTPSIISGLRAKCNHFIVAGDEHQSIYRKDVRYHETVVTPSQIPALINEGNDIPLTIVHRLSPAIQEAVQRFMPSLDISGLRNPAVKVTKPRLCRATTYANEIKYIWDEAVKAPNTGGGTAAILLPRHDLIMNFVDEVCELNGRPHWNRAVNIFGKTDYKAMNGFLRNNGIRLQYIANGFGSFQNEDSVYIMTYWSAKGLDFDNVFLPEVSEHLYISPDPEIAQAAFMVAMTRSRNELYICYTGAPNEYLASFAGICSTVNIDNYLEQKKCVSSHGTHVNGGIHF